MASQPLRSFGASRSTSSLYASLHWKQMQLPQTATSSSVNQPLLTCTMRMPYSAADCSSREQASSLHMRHLRMGEADAAMRCRIQAKDDVQTICLYTEKTGQPFDVEPHRLRMVYGYLIDRTTGNLRHREARGVWTTHQPLRVPCLSKSERSNTGSPTHNPNTALVATVAHHEAFARLQGHPKADTNLATSQLPAASLRGELHELTEEPRRNGSV